MKWNEYMLQLLTRENITLALSIFGSIGTLITLVSSYLTARKNLKITITTAVYREEQHLLVIGLAFENRSRLPIAITSISLSSPIKDYVPLKYPRYVGEYIHKKGNQIVDQKFTYNLQLPFGIQQLDASSGDILFDIPREDFQKLSTPLMLLVHSTRGCVQKTELRPDQIRYIDALHIQ